MVSPFNPVAARTPIQRVSTLTPVNTLASSTANLAQNATLNGTQNAFSLNTPAGSNPMLQPMLDILSLVMNLLSSIMGLMTGKTGANSGLPVTGTGTTTPGTVPQGQTQFTQDDALNYILGATHGGTTIQEPAIFGSFMNPNSRFVQSGDSNEFDAAIAKIYAAQFAGVAGGLDVLYDPGKDNINQIAANIVQGQNIHDTGLTPEAKLFADVAATYRGDFGNRGAYNLPIMRQLLVNWGRSDLANQPNVGLPGADGPTLGMITKALNEEPNPAIRQAWLQQIFDFQNNTPNSPSGAVPDLVPYQRAIALVQNGAIDRLMANFNAGISTTGAIA